MIFLRSCLFVAYFAALTFIMGIGSIPLRYGAKRLALPYAKSWTRAALAGLKAICGIEFVVTGKENLTGLEPCLIASQHQSAFDALVWMNLVPRPAYVMKRELLRIPFVGAMLLRSGMIPVERGAGSRAMRSLLTQASNAAQDQRQIIIFPEGTRTAPGEVATLRPGIQALANHTGLPVIPVATNSGRFWGNHLLNLRPGVIQIVIGPALTADRERGKLLTEIAASWQHMISREQLSLQSTIPVDKSVGVSGGSPAI